MIRIWVCADVDSEESAKKLIADLEEVIGKHDGDLQYSEEEDLG